jgi:hypothetical protein
METSKLGPSRLAAPIDSEPSTATMATRCLRRGIFFRGGLMVSGAPAADAAGALLAQNPVTAQLPKPNAGSPVIVNCMIAPALLVSGRVLKLSEVMTAKVELSVPNPSLPE